MRLGLLLASAVSFASAEACSGSSGETADAHASSDGGANAADSSTATMITEADSAAPDSGIPIVVDADVVVYGATPSGIAAAVSAGRLGKRVVLVEKSHWIGGMMSGGLSQTDIGTAAAVGGVAAEVLARTYASEVEAGVADGSRSIYNFEPHVAKDVFSAMLAEANVRVVTDARAVRVEMSNGTISSFFTDAGPSYAAKMFIDASYEGDLMVLAGVSYAWGREPASQYGEPQGGVQTPRAILEHDLASDGGDAGAEVFTIDPYVVPGVPDSGLIYEVSAGPVPALGAADQRVMAYNYRLCATDFATHPDNAVSFTAKVPTGYDATKYEGVTRYVEALLALHPTEDGAAIGAHFLDVNALLPAGKRDINGGTAFSTDVVLVPNAYPTGDAATQANVARDVADYIRGLFYFLQTPNPRLPASLNAYIAAWGYCKDEFVDNDHFPTQLYIREGLRMVGAYVMTELDVVGKTSVTDGIGLADYNMDSHIVELVDVDGSVLQEGYESVDYSAYGSKAGTPYSIPYRALTPKPNEAKNLLVSVTMSASRMANRSLRVEPTYMIMGQAAGTAASLAIDEGVPVQAVDYPSLRRQLAKDNQVLASP